MSGASGPAPPPPDVPVAALVRVGHEVAVWARRLGASALSVELAGRDGPLHFSCERGRVLASARGWELELSALAAWEHDRPPGS